MSEPRTPLDKALGKLGDAAQYADWGDAILAIEDEAAASAPDRGLREALTDAFHAMDAACKWAAGETAGVRTIADADRHMAGYDALLDATVRAGQAAGLLRATPPWREGLPPKDVGEAER